MRYKKVDDRNVKQIAQNLDVNYLVEGSVQREGNKVHVTAELIDAGNDSNVWSETYDGEAADIIAIQTEIAQRISNQLGAKLSPRESTELASRPTKDLAAFESYIRAQALMETNYDDEKFKEDYARAVQLLEQAVARDPQFAAGYWALAQANIQLFHTSEPPKPEYRDRAEAALKQAQRIAPEAGETFLAQARIIYFGLTSGRGTTPSAEEYWMK
jgi:non-specific serine/threonine protein kinase